MFQLKVNSSSYSHSSVFQALFAIHFLKNTNEPAHRRDPCVLMGKQG